MPAAPRPTFTRLTTARVTASKIETSAPLNVETNTRLPSGVNFRRLAPVTSAASVWITFLPAKSIMEIVPSWAFAAQISLPPGETAKPPRAPSTATRDHRLIPGCGRRSARGAGAATARRGSTPGIAPASAARALFDQRHGGGTDIGGDHALQVFRNKNHVGPVLAGTEHPIDLLRRRI